MILLTRAFLGCQLRPIGTTRTIRLQILNDHSVNSNREFKVILTNATPSVLLGAAETVIVHDDEWPGGLDFTFTPPSAAEWSGNIEAVAQQPDGKLLVAGVIGSRDGERYTALDRLNQDGVS